MRAIIRFGRAAAAASLLGALWAAPAVAGNWGEVTMLDGMDDPPVAGEERTIRFSVLQHGVTPVEWGQVELTAWLADDSARMSVEATSTGGGEWVAAVTFPTDGDWFVRVLHSDLETSDAVPVTVGPGAAIAWLPAVIALTGMGIIAAALASGGRSMVRHRVRATASSAP